MRYVSLKQAKPGMRLGYDIYDSMGRTLAGANVPITENYIERLIELGFDGIYIKDELSEDIEIEPVISPQLRTAGVICVRDKNIDGCKEVAKRMVEEILSKGSCSLDMSDLRSFDDYTYAHSVNVAVISCTIAIGLGMNEEELINVVMAGLLHDLGKLSIDPDILNKAGRLTPEEYEIVTTHARLSYELVQERWDIAAQVKNAIYFHHQNVDGSGYPQSPDGTVQTIYTKILHVADVYDALISKRPYKKSYSPKEASEYLMGGCDRLFDYETVETLLKFVPLYAKGTEVVLSDGRHGIVYDNVGVHNFRPVIKLMDATLLDLSVQPNLSLGIETLHEKNAAPLEAYEKEREKMLKGINKKHR